MLPPSQVFQVPSGLTQYGPGDGAPSHSQQLLVWWPGEKFHVEQLPALQHAASHAAAVRLGSRCMFLHCSPARLCGKLQFLVKSRAVATTVQGQDANNSSGIAIGRAICAVPDARITPAAVRRGSSKACMCCASTRVRDDRSPFP